MIQLRFWYLKKLHFWSKTSFWSYSKWLEFSLRKNWKFFDMSKLHVFQNFFFFNFWPKITQFKSKFSRGQNNWEILKSKVFKINFRLNWHVNYEKFHKIVIFVHFWPENFIFEIRNFMEHNFDQLMSQYDVIWLVDYELRSTGLTSDSVRSDNYSEAWNCES